MQEKKKLEDYLLPIVRERKGTFNTYYTFKIITRKGKGKYRGGYVNPSLKELPHLGLETFLDHSFLIITPEFVRLAVKPSHMLIYLKPFEIIEFINGIRELCLEAESKFKSRIVRKKRVVRRKFEIKLPETYMYVGTAAPMLWYKRSKKVIRCCYDLPVSDDIITWIFNEVEKEFLSFVEAYEEERRRQKILQEQKTEQKQEKTQS